MSVDLNVPLASILDYIQNDMLCTIFFSLEMACIIAIIQQSNCNCVIYRTEYQQNPLKNTYGPIWRDFNPRQTVCMGSPSPPVTKITIVDSHSILVCAENQRNHQWGCILRQHFVVFHSQSCVSLNIYKY